LFFQWSGQGFQNDGLDHLIEMEFSSPWINCYIWPRTEDQCLRIQLHVYVGFLWKPRPCSTPYSDNRGQLGILSKDPSLMIHLKCKLPLSHQTCSIFHRSFNSFWDVLWKAINLITFSFTVIITTVKIRKWKIIFKDCSARPLQSQHILHDNIISHLLSRVKLQDQTDLTVIPLYNLYIHS